MLLKNSWKEVLQDEFCKTYFLNLQDFLLKEEAIYTIYPPVAERLQALEHSDFKDVRVVIIGQDPYHGPNQAHGLAFSVLKGSKLPPSLKNIFKELSSDIDGFVIPTEGNLSTWAKQGVLLLNTTLTVRHGEPASHQQKGWEIFTDKIITELSENRQNLVFMLWGKHAQEKAKLIGENHLILQAAHPSPFSAYNGFFGCKHFSKANNYLEKNGSKSIDWNLPNQNTTLSLF